MNDVELQPQAGSYPIPFSWSNCTTVGQSVLSGNWSQQSLRPVGTSCSTLIRLQGSGAQTVRLAWWGNG